MYKTPRNGSDMLMLGLLGDDVQTRDQFVSDELTSHLFAEHPPDGLGEDLASLNIQRGRDHGIPGQTNVKAGSIVELGRRTCDSMVVSSNPGRRY